MKATWENTLLAESDHTVVVEGNHYFPPASIKREYFTASDTHSTCHWKGVASYYDVKVGDKTNADAAWYYRNRRKPPNRSRITSPSGAASR